MTFRSCCYLISINNFIETESILYRKVKRRLENLLFPPILHLSANPVDFTSEIFLESVLLYLHHHSSPSYLGEGEGVPNLLF